MEDAVVCGEVRWDGELDPDSGLLAVIRIHSRIERRLVPSAIVQRSTVRIAEENFGEVVLLRVIDPDVDLVARFKYRLARVVLCGYYRECARSCREEQT